MAGNASIYDQVEKLVDETPLATVFDALAMAIAGRIRKDALDADQEQKLKTTHKELERMARRHEVS